MNRRTLLKLGALTLSGLPLATLSRRAAAQAQDYAPGVVDAALSQGKTVFLDFKASWCSTCAAQGRVLAELKAENPAYEQTIAFIDVDWDTYKSDEITQRLNIPRRSTLVVLKGDAELGRIVAGTARDDIKALMDVALGAAGS